MGSFLCETRVGEALCVPFQLCQPQAEHSQWQEGAGQCWAALLQAVRGLDWVSLPNPQLAVKGRGLHAPMGGSDPGEPGVLPLPRHDVLGLRPLLPADGWWAA